MELTDKDKGQRKTITEDMSLRNRAGTEGMEIVGEEKIIIVEKDHGQLIEDDHETDQMIEGEDGEIDYHLETIFF